MIDPVNLAGDVITGSTALGGLLLVYLGAITTSYARYDKQAQPTVRREHKIRAWLAVIGIFFSLVSAGLALVGKWANNGWAVSTAIFLLVLALFWVMGAAILSAREVT